MGSPPELRLSAEDSSCSFVLRSPDWADDDLLWLTAELTGPGCRASTGVLTLRGDGLAHYFSDLEASWRGWSGGKRWQSMEGTLELCARHEHGHVELRCSVWENYRMNSWKAEVVVVLDAGEALRHFASDARHLVHRAAGRP